MYVQSETSFCCLLLLFVEITAGDILQPPPATLLAGGFQSSLLYAICTKIISLLFICALEWPVPCTLYHVPRISYHMPRTPCPVPRTSYLVPRTLYLVPRTSYSVPLTQHSVPRIDIYWDYLVLLDNSCSLAKYKLTPRVCYCFRFSFQQRQLKIIFAEFYILSMLGKQGGKVHIFKIYKYICTVVEHK
jgi:hypothetical protein